MGAEWGISDRTLHTLAQLLAGGQLNGTRPETVEPFLRRLLIDVAGAADAERAARFRDGMLTIGYSTPEIDALVGQICGRDPNQPKPSRYGFTPQAAPDLMAQEFPPLLEVVPGLFYEGSTLLCGSPKAGKSIMMYGIAIAVASGGYVFGTIKVPQADVLYLALEDGPRRIQRRLAKILGEHGRVPAGLDFVPAARPLAAGLLEDLGRYADDHPACRLIVIDTLSKVRTRAAMQQGNAYQQDYDELAPITAFAQERRICVVLVYHTRKAHSDDAMDMVNATQGAGGGVDSVVVLQRQRNGERLARLAIMGRDLDEETERQLLYDPLINSYRTIEQAEAAQITATSGRKAIFAALREAASALTAQDIAAKVGRKYEDVRQQLFQMVDQGAIVRPERGRYAMPGMGDAPKEDDF